jgi:hypothetical protein
MGRPGIMAARLRRLEEEHVRELGWVGRLIQFPWKHSHLGTQTFSPNSCFFTGDHLQTAVPAVNSRYKKRA